MFTTQIDTKRSTVPVYAELHIILHVCISRLTKNLVEVEQIPSCSTTIGKAFLSEWITMSIRQF
jgi:hypothetical protein